MRRLSIWPSLPPGVHLRRPHPLPWPLDRPGTRLFSRARHGLWHAIRALGLREGDQVLTPAYHHGSEVEALRRAGLECRFYEGEEGVRPPGESRLESLLAPRVAALYLIHTLGFPGDAPRWRSWADRHGLLLIEDAAMAWLATEGGVPVGALGDAAIVCVYKTVGVPDGGAVVCARPVRPPDGRRALGLVRTLRRHGAWATERVPWIRPRRAGRRFAYDPREDFALGNPRTPATLATRWLLPRLARPGVAAARRERFRWLGMHLGSALPGPFASLPEGASPFVFPVEVDDKPGALQHLRRAGIDAADLWSVPHPVLPAERFPRAAALRARLIGLPVHQDLDAADLRRIVDVAKRVLP